MPQMIPKNLDTVESLCQKPPKPHWSQAIAGAFSVPEDLLSFLEIDPGPYREHCKARKLFPMRVPLSFAQRMEKGNIDDPLLQQVFPLAQEFESKPGFSVDPLLEHNNGDPGVIHKYQSRVLLVIKGGCAVNCRYCFRRHFPYQENQLSRAGWQDTLNYIANDDNIQEVIFSGGDPLMAKDDFLSWLVQEIEAISHVKTLRIHTRLPVVIPERINSELIQWLTSTRLNSVMVVHINHANEVSDELAANLRKLRDCGVTLLNQSVLLKGVNDTTEAQVALNERVFDASVLPYYLHLLDKVAGAAHFDVSEQAAIAIQAEVIKRLPGYLVPKLVREIGGQPSKTPIDLRLYP